MTDWIKIATIGCLFCWLAGCSKPDVPPEYTVRNNVSLTCKQHYLPTDPSSVMLVEKPTLDTTYRVIGDIHVNNQNTLGSTRSKNTLNELLKEKASMVGGNAVIAISYGDTEVTGKIVRFSS